MEVWRFSLFYIFTAIRSRDAEKFFEIFQMESKEDK